MNTIIVEAMMKWHLKWPNGLARAHPSPSRIMSVRTFYFWSQLLWGPYWRYLPSYLSNELFPSYDLFSLLCRWSLVVVRRLTKRQDLYTWIAGKSLLLLPEELNHGDSDERPTVAAPSSPANSRTRIRGAYRRPRYISNLFLLFTCVPVTEDTQCI